MGIQKVVAKQYRDKVNQMATRLSGSYVEPPEGWLRTVRTALGMSGAQLAKRIGVTKARISRAEHDEPLGRVTLKTMESMAEAMNCKFVYAIVPEKNIEQVIRDQAVLKATALVTVASTHMALESQTLNTAQLEYEIERIANEIIEKMPSDLWSDQ